MARAHAKTQDSSLVESVQSACRVDRDSHTIRGVKLLGLKSQNSNRSYREGAVSSAAGLYEGAIVYIDHPGKANEGRRYQDRFGVVESVKFRPGEGLYGNLSYNPKHLQAEQILWDAEHGTHGVGLSHNIFASTSKSGRGEVVEQIKKVRSVDLVAEPATTNALHESKEQKMSLTVKSVVEKVKVPAALKPLMEALAGDALCGAATVEVSTTAADAERIAEAMSAGIYAIMEADDMMPVDKQSKLKKMLGMKGEEEEEEEVADDGGGEFPAKKKPCIESVQVQHKRLMAHEALGARSIPTKPELVTELMECKNADEMASKIQGWPPAKRGAARPRFGAVTEQADGAFPATHDDFMRELRRR